MKLGLVIEGGASRAYFSTGVMDFLLEKKIYADYVIGVSAGIANGVSYVSRQIGRNIDIGENYVHDKRYMGLKYLMDPKNRSFYNLKFVFGGGVEEFVPFDYDAYYSSGGKTVAVVTNIETGKPEYLDISHYKGDWKPLIASCSLPILFKPEDIDGRLYMDGGISDPIPIDRAIEEGCDRIIVITTRERSYKKTKETGVGVSSLAYRHYPKFVGLLKSRVDTYNKAHQKALEYEKQGRIFLIAPEDTKGWGRTESDPYKIRAMHNTGHSTAEKLYESLEKYLNE